MKRFAIVDGGRRGAEPCATLTYDEKTGEFSLMLAEGVSEDDVPMLFAPFVRRGERQIGPDWSRRWVESRIVPPSRQNLGQVLKAHGLEEYDEVALLEASCGRSSQDDFEVVSLEELGGEAEEGSAVQIGQQLADARRSAGLTQQELAERAGVRQAVVSRLERGKTNPTLGLLEDIAHALVLRLDMRFSKR